MRFAAFTNAGRSVCQAALGKVGGVAGGAPGSGTSMSGAGGMISGGGAGGLAGAGVGAGLGGGVAMGDLLARTNEAARPELPRPPRQSPGRARLGLPLAPALV